MEEQFKEAVSCLKIFLNQLKEINSLTQMNELHHPFRNIIVTYKKYVGFCGNLCVEENKAIIEKISADLSNSLTLFIKSKTKVVANKKDTNEDDLNELARLCTECAYLSKSIFDHIRNRKKTNQVSAPPSDSSTNSTSTTASLSRDSTFISHYESLAESDVPKIANNNQINDSQRSPTESNTTVKQSSPSTEVSDEKSHSDSLTSHPASDDPEELNNNNIIKPILESILGDLFNDEESLQYEGVRNVSLDELIGLLIHEDTKPRFILECIVTHHLYSSTQEFSELILQKWNNDQFKQPKSIVTILDLWKEYLPYQFNNLIPILKTWSKQEEFKFLSNYLTQSKNPLEAQTSVTTPKESETLTLLLNIESIEIARQLSLLSLKYFKEIPLEEFLENDPNSKLNQLKKWDEFLLFWTQTMILSEMQIKNRIKILSKFIEIIEHLLKLNNMHTALQLLNGVQSLPISRLKKTWAGLSSKIKTKNDKITEFQIDDYKQLRSSIKTPGIPDLNYLLTKLSNIKSTIEFDKENLDLYKIQNIAKDLIYIRQFQLVDYKINPIDSIQNFITKSKIIQDMDILNKFSNYMEPMTDQPGKEDLELVGEEALQERKSPKRSIAGLSESRKRIHQDFVTFQKKKEKTGGVPGSLLPNAAGPIPAQIYITLINKQIEVLNQQYKSRCETFNQFFDNLEKQVVQMRQTALQDLDVYRLQTLNEISNLQKTFKTEGTLPVISFNEKKEQLLMEQNKLKKLLSEQTSTEADCADESEGNTNPIV